MCACARSGTLNSANPSRIRLPVMWSSFLVAELFQDALVRNNISVTRLASGKDPRRFSRLPNPRPDGGSFASSSRARTQWLVLAACVSRHHARIEIKDGQFFIEDLGSAHGTFINGHQLTPRRKYPLINGNNIRLGETVLKFLAPAPAPGMFRLPPARSPMHRSTEQQIRWGLACLMVDSRMTAT